jgi:PKD repeat protein
MALRILSLGGSSPDPTPTPDPAPNPTPAPLPDPGGTPDTSLLTAVITSTVDETDPLLVEFSGTGSHAPEGVITDYEWNLGDGGSGSDPAVDHRYTQPGTYKVTLKVTDETGHSATTSFVLTLTGLSGMPVAQWSAMPADSPLIYTFDGSQSVGGEGPLVQFEWDFGDSSTATGATVAHEYKTPGSYEVKLKVTDEKGKSTIAAQPLQAGDHQAPLLDPSPSGGGGGCAMVQEVSPTDFRQALPTLLVFFAPFWRRVMKRARRTFRT